MNSAGSSCGELVKLGLFDLGQRHLVRDSAALEHDIDPPAFPLQRLGRARCVAVERNGADVPADERFHLAPWPSFATGRRGGLPKVY
jgi:hypothetical protein